MASTQLKELNTTESKNTFRFQPFRERIKTLKINVTRRVDPRQTKDTPTVGDSFFYEALEHWREHDCTLHFVAFSRAVHPYCSSLPQIVYHKDKIVALLLEHLSVPETLATESLLGMITALARDLQGDLYPYFEQIFNVIRSLLPNAPPSLLEHAFNCLAYLFKYLSKQILDNINAIYDIFLPLFSDTKSFIRHFASEAFSFLLRKLNADEVKNAIHHVLQSLTQRKTREIREAVAMLFYETCKHVDGRLHSRAKLFLENVLRLSVQEGDEHTFETSCLLLTLLMHHIEKEHSKDLWDVLLSLPTTHCSTPELQRLLNFLFIAIMARKGGRILSHEQIFKTLHTLTKSSEVLNAQTTGEAFVKTLTATLRNASLDDLVLHAKPVLRALISSRQYPLIFMLSEALRQMKWEYWSKWLLPDLLQCLDSYIAQSEQLNKLGIVVLHNLAKAATEQGETNIPGKLSLSVQKCIKNTIMSRLNNVWTDFRNNVLDIPMLFNIVKGLLSPKHSKDVCQAIVDFLAETLDKLQIQSIHGDFEQDMMNIDDRPEIRGSLVYAAQTVLGLGLETVSTLLRNNPDFLERSWSIFMNGLILLKGNPVGLSGMATYAQTVRGLSADKFGRDIKSQLFKMIQSEISSPKASIRVSVLTILSQFNATRIQDEQSEETPEDELFTHLLAFETTSTSIATIRDKLIHLRKCERFYTRMVIPEAYNQVLMMYLMSQLTINFAPLWKEVNEMVNRLVNEWKDGNKVFWEVWWNYFEEMCQNDSVDKMEIGKIEGTRVMLDMNVATKDRKSYVDLKFDDTHVQKTETLWKRVQQMILGSVADDGLNWIAREFVEACIVDDPKVDGSNLAIQMLRTISTLPQVAEAKSRSLIPVFLSLSSSSTNMNKSTRAQLLELMTVMSKFKNPKALYMSEQVHERLLELLAKSDADVQSLSIQCIATWKHASILTLLDKLKALTDETKFREELSTLPCDQILEEIPEHQQPILFDALTRLFYGKLTARRGRNSQSGLKARRVAVFAWMAGAPEIAIESLWKLMIKGIDFQLQHDDQCDGKDGNDLLQSQQRTRKQLGLLIVLEDFVKQLRNRLSNFLNPLFDTLISLVQSSQSRLEGIRSDLEAVDAEPIADDDNENDNEEEENLDVSSQNGQIEVLKRIRTLGLHRIAQIFQSDILRKTTIEIAVPHMQRLFTVYLNDRIPLLATESTQAPGPILELFAAWAKRSKYHQFLTFHDQLLPCVFDIMSAKNVKEKVVSAVLSVVEDILAPSEELSADMQIDDLAMDNVTAISGKDLLEPHIMRLLSNLENALHRFVTQNSKRELSREGTLSSRAIKVVSEISPLVSDGTGASKVVELLMPQLRLSNVHVSEIMKTHILQILSNFIPLLPLFQDMQVHETPYYHILSQLFGTLETRVSREALVSVFSQFVAVTKSFNDKHTEAASIVNMEQVARLVREMNSWSTKRIDEPDFDLKFSAFSEISRSLYSSLNYYEWLPLLQNLLFYMCDESEFSVRSAATHGVQTLVAHIASSNQDIVETEKTQGRKNEMIDLVIHIILPRIKKGIKHRSAVVRQEVVAVLHECVRRLPLLDPFSELQHLLSDDAETDFFNNIYHMQMHRRVRAIRLLCENVDKFKSNTVAQLLIPLVIHNVYEHEKSMEQSLVNESIVTVGKLSRVLRWSQYYMLVHRTIMSIDRRPQIQKALIRLLVAVLDSFGFDLSPTVNLEDVKEDEPTPDAESDNEETQDVQADLAQETTMSKDAQTKQNFVNRVLSTVIDKMLPSLYKLLLLKEGDDEAMSLRVPIALAITKLIQKLPKDSLEQQLPKLLTQLALLLRSRAQSTRDVTRSTMVEISQLLGPRYFYFIIKELKSALTRGYQKHVLGFTVHALLVHLVPSLQVGEIDDCVEPIVEIAVEDIFGAAGEEKDVEELQGTQIREMKVTKSFESFELITSIITLRLLSLVLVPLKRIMMESNSTKTGRKLDQALARLAVGLHHNTGVQIEEMLVLIHGLITENLPLSKLETTSLEGKAIQRKSNFTKVLEQQENRHMVWSNSRIDPTAALKYFEANAHRFVEFGLSLLLTALKRDKVNLGNSQHLQMVDPFVRPLGNCLYSKHENVIVSALKVYTVLVRVSVPSMTEALPVLTRRMFQLIVRTGTSQSDVVQQCFKLLSVVLRQHKHIEVKEKQLITLLEMVTPDLQDSQRQSTSFALIRTLLSRQMIVKEMYDLIDVVSKMMITSHSSHVRELSRLTVLQFLLEYPQGNAKLKKQMFWIMKQLQYDHETGRESTLELVNMLIEQLSDSVLEEYSEMMLMSLILTLTSDDSNKCREMAGTFIKNLFNRLNQAKIDRVVLMIDEWLKNSKENRKMARVGAQVYGLLIDALKDGAKRHTDTVLPHLLEILGTDAAELQSLKGTEEQEDSASEHWEIVYYCLNAIGKLMVQFPALIVSQRLSMMWPSIFELLFHPHMWVRNICIRLFNQHFAYIAPETLRITTTNNYDIFLNGLSSDAHLNEHMRVEDTNSSAAKVLKLLALRFAKMLTVHLVNDDVAKYLVKNLFFLGKCLYHLDRRICNHSRIQSSPDTELHADEEEEEKSNEDDDVEHDLSRKKEPTQLLWLFKKLSYLARAETAQHSHKRILVRKSVFQWYAAMATYITKEHLAVAQDLEVPELSEACIENTPLHTMVSTLYRIVNDETLIGTEDVEELKRLGQEVMDLLQKRVGTTAYLTTYNLVHKKVKEVRQNRQQSRAVLAVKDPETFAKRKLQKNDMKKQGRKRKAQESAQKRQRFKDSKKLRVR